jgi:acyl carrier protein phosphodiesterase
MNYLAHLHLGGQRPGQLLGSLYGDFVKGRLQGQFVPDVEAGIRLHRSIDIYTDSHPLVGAALSRFSLTRRRYAGIVLDVFFDHCLARDWAQYADRPLELFTRDVYRVLAAEPQRRSRPTWRPMTGWVPIGISRCWSRCCRASPGACRGRRNWRRPWGSWSVCTSR